MNATSAASYYPYVPYCRGATSRFEGENASAVAEAILRNQHMREVLGLNGTAGYHLHSVTLNAATHEANGLTRRLVLLWQAMPTLPQERRGEENPVMERVITLEHGEDPRPEASWVWELANGKLVAKEVLDPASSTSPAAGMTP